MAGCSGKGGNASTAPPSRQVTFYAFSDEVTERTIPGFEQRSGRKVALDPVPDNPTLLTKMLAGGSGYDVVMPTNNFLQPLIAAGSLRKLDKAKLPNWEHLDPEVLAVLSQIDPGNLYAVPYLWGTVGFGINRRLVTKALGRAPPDSVQLLFDPETTRRLASCGIA